MENLTTKWKIKKAAGKCYCCELDALDGQSYCEKHLSAKKERNKLRRSRVCDSCGGPREKGGFCTSCWSKRIDRIKKRERDKLLRGECKTCPNSIKDGHVRCEVCLEKVRQQRLKREAKRREQHLCLCCGTPISKLSILCITCHAKNISSWHFKTVKRANELIEILNNQNSFCPYTGKHLIIGENCSLDHITPKSRGGTDDKENLQWVYNGEIDVNWMKGSLTDNEFKNSISLIYGYLSRR